MHAHNSVTCVTMCDFKHLSSTEKHVGSIDFLNNNQKVQELYSCTNNRRLTFIVKDNTQHEAKDGIKSKRYMMATS